MATIWLAPLYYAGANPLWQRGVNVMLLSLFPRRPSGWWLYFLVSSEVSLGSLACLRDDLVQE